jgi:4'-phosphopantetheinyl transferase EntD
MTRREIESHGRLDGRGQALMRSLVFSAKEAAFKAQYSLTSAMLDFQDVDARVDIDHLTFYPAYCTPEVAIVMQPFTQSCRLFHMEGIVGSAVKITTGI